MDESADPALDPAHPDLSIEDACAIAKLTRRHRGRRQLGYELGYTSSAMRVQMNTARSAARPGCSEATFYIRHTKTGA
ncbi:MAG: hypothetical protein K2Y17_00980 [Qipengyuania sp.]|nr:hypothetical protein [Qipengyuania sp.]